MSSDHYNPPGLMRRDCHNCPERQALGLTKLQDSGLNFISNHLTHKKTKPDSLTSQGLPGINAAKVVIFSNISIEIFKFKLISIKILVYANDLIIFEDANFGVLKF